MSTIREPDRSGAMVYKVGTGIALQFISHRSEGKRHKGDRKGMPLPVIPSAFLVQLLQCLAGESSWRRIVARRC
jgi:hypothetical protein